MNNSFVSLPIYKDHENNVFEIDLLRDPLQPRIALAGEVGGLKPTAVAVASAEPRLFVVSRSAEAVELVRMFSCIMFMVNMCIYLTSCWFWIVNSADSRRSRSLSWPGRCAPGISPGSKWMLSTRHATSAEASRSRTFGKSKELSDVL